MTSEPRLLPEVHYQQLGNGRVRCIETGHEMPEAHARDYGFTKKCKTALFDIALGERKGAFKFFGAQYHSQGKIVCNLTGVILNKTEEALWKHMTGKKFTRALDEMEAVSATIGGKPEHTSDDRTTGELANGNSAEAADLKPKWTSRKAENAAKAASEEASERMDEDDLESDNPEFWIPPVGERWDNDDGEDRWHAPAGSSHVMQREVRDMSESDEGASLVEETKYGDVTMGEGIHCPEILIDEFSMKRTARAIGPFSVAGRKTKRKRCKRLTEQ